MSYIESHQALDNHPKTRKAARLLGISRGTMIGHLHVLWHWAVDSAPAGDLTRCDPQDVAEGAMWEGDAAEFIAALVDCGANGHAGFLDGTPDGRLLLHDWRDYAGKLIERREANAERMRHARAGHAPESPPLAAAPPPARVANAGDTRGEPAFSVRDTCETRAEREQHNIAERSGAKQSEAKQSNNNPPTPREQTGDGLDGDCREVVVALLSDEGVSPGVAEDLAGRFPYEAVQRQVHWHRFRLEEKNAAGQVVRNPAGLLCKAIEGSWAIPPTAKQAELDAEARSRRDERTARAAEQDRARQEVARADLARCQAAFGRLAPEEQEAVDRETRERVRAESIVFREKLDKGQMGPALRARLTAVRNEIIGERGHVKGPAPGQAAPAEAAEAPPEGDGQ